MLWHSGAWPGLLGKLAAPELEARLQAAQELAQDFLAWQEAHKYAKASPFLASVVKLSPFSTAVMFDLGKLAASLENLQEDSPGLETLRTVAQQ
eukprot:336390-Lingulodinium_polyedra.AAC.1